MLWRPASRQRKRPGAVPASGTFPASPTRQRRYIPSTRHLDEDRRVVAQCGAGRLERHRGKACCPRGSVPSQLEVVADASDAGRPLANRGTGSRHWKRPSAFDEQLGFGCAGKTTNNQRSAAEVRTLDEHVAYLRVGSAWLRVQIISVIPDGEQTKVGDWREHGCSCACHHPSLSSADAQPPAVTFGWPQIRGERNDIVIAE